MKRLGGMRWIAAAACLLVFAMLGALYIQAQAFDEDDYLRDTEELAQLRRTYSWVQTEVLRARGGMQPHYDRMTEWTAQLEKLAAQTTADHHDEKYAQHEKLALQRKAMVDESARVAGLIEQFKSANSVLRNSLAFAPTAAGDALEVLDGHGQGASRLAHRVHEAVEAVLVMALQDALGPDAERRSEALQALDLLEAQAAALPAAPRERVKLFALHVRTLLAQDDRLAELIEAISASPLHRVALESAQLLHEERHRAAGVEDWVQGFLAAFAAALAILLGFAAVKLVGSRVQIERMNLRLSHTNAELEERVARRTSELVAAQDELLATARRAGMAEIASSVLHNVGNILNSVNVSAGLIAGNIRQSRAAGLERAVQLLESHGKDLGRFVTEDEQGRLLPAYLRELSLALQRERQAALREVDHLTSSIDHIKAVVATQQSYAGQAAARVPVHLGEVIEDALRINGCNLADRSLAVVKSYDEVPVALLDRDSVLQILVNLVSNARHAMRDAGIERPRLIVRMGRDGDALQVSVSDEGVGIAPENVTRIFSHGFTTRRGGHGFGLHSCAIAASRMGGTLGVHSDGPGKGSTFTLRLPLPETEGVPA